MRHLVLILACAIFPALGLAQDSTTEADRGFITGFLERNLSSAGREVRIEGFAGALSSRATFDEMTIADADGVWLTIRNGAISWNRSALLSGEVDVEELTAAAIEMPRLPQGEAANPSVARGFSLPELPVSVRIGSVRADRIDLGAPVLGEPVTAFLSGGLSLSAGAGAATVEIRRTDGKAGTITLGAEYANATRQVRIDLLAQEGPGGIAATKLGLPGRPEASLAVSGAGVIDNLAVDVALTTDRQPRLAGKVQFVSSGDPARPTRSFKANLSGNPVPLFAPQYQAFFGDAVSLEAEGRREPSGRFDLSRFSLAASAVKIDGTLRLRPGGMPEFADLAVTLAGKDGDGVLLPLPGTQTRIGAADLKLGFDAGAGDGWRLSGRMTGLERGALRIGAVSLNGSGRVAAGGLSGALSNVIGGTVSFGAGGVVLAEPGLDRAIGPQLVGNTVFSWQGGQPLRFSRLEVAGDGYTAKGAATVSGLEQDFTVSGRLEAAYSDLARLSGLVSRPLAGAARVAVSGSGSPLSGVFDAEVRVEGTDLQVGQTEVDSLLRGRSTIAGTVSRTTEGTMIRDLVVTASTLSARLDGRIAPADEDLSARLGFSDLSALGRGYRGALEAVATVKREGGGPRQISLSGTGSGLATGQAQIDRLLSGPIELKVAASEREGVVSIESFQIVGGQLRVEAQGEIGAGSGEIALSARLSDMALFAPAFPGPVTAIGTLSGTKSGYMVSLDLSGPGATSARLSGPIAADLGTADLTAKGSIQSAIFNPMLAPRNVEGPLQFDLRVSGRPALASVSGPISASGARLVAPTYGIAVEGINATAILQDGRARIEASGSVRGGGSLRLAGPVALTAPFPADLSIALTRVRLRDPELYETRVSGSLSLSGPILDGARLSGAVQLRQTEIRIPSTGLGTNEFSGVIRHVNEPVASRDTRARAGLLGESAEAGARTVDPVALDLTVSAPERIFVRGRGIDAELGGSLHLGGRTDAVVATGQFELVRGRLDLLGKRFDMDEGLVRLEGPVIPYIRFSASSQNEGVTSTIVIEGLATSPEIHFSASPPLPEEEVVSQLLFGRGLSSLSAFQAAQLASAVATLSGRGGEGIIGRLRTSFGLDDLDVQTDENGSVAVRAGKYLSRNLYTDVTVGAEGKTEINLNLDVSKSVKVRGSLGSDGATGVGIYYERDY